MMMISRVLLEGQDNQRNKLIELGDGCRFFKLEFLRHLRLSVCPIQSRANDSLTTVIPEAVEGHCEGYGLLGMALSRLLKAPARFNFLMPASYVIVRLLRQLRQ